MIRWPGKYFSFYRQARAARDKILGGTLLAIDPASGASSLPGYALFKQGRLIERGTVAIESKKDTQLRLSELYDCLREEFQDVDVLAVELLRGAMVSPTLHWSTGVAVAAVNPKTLIQVPIPVWKAVAKCDPEYEKADDLDATKIGEVLVLLANEEPEVKLTRRKKK